MEDAPRYPNRIKEVIKRNGYMLHEIAQALYISDRTLRTYCSGKRAMPRPILEALAAFLECPLAELINGSELEKLVPPAIQPSPAARPASPPLPLDQSEDSPSPPAVIQGILRETQENQEREEQDMNSLRRQLLGLGVTEATIVLSSHYWLNPDILERLVRALKKPSNVDDTLLTNLEMITRNNRLRFVQTQESVRLLPAISGHLHTITQLLEHSLPTPAYMRLCTMAGETTELIGNILFNAGDSNTSINYYNVTLEMAEEARQDVLYADVLGRKSFVAIHYGNPRDALPLLQEAHKKAEQSASDVVAAYLWAIEAEAQANIQAPDDCSRALELSEFFLQRGRSGTIPTAFGETTHAPFSDTALLGYKGICHVLLKQPLIAQGFLNQRLALTRPERIHKKSITLADLAMTYVQSGEVEEACKYAAQAILLVARTKSASVFRRVLKVRHALKAWCQTPYVKRLDEQIMVIQSSLPH